MFWPFVVTCGIGLLLGVSVLRVHLVAVASVVAGLVGAISASIAQWSVGDSILFIAGLIVALQVSYLGGILLFSVWGRAKAPQTILRSSHIDQ